MKKLVADAVKETTVTTGTGTVTLTQATGWVRFGDRFLNGENCYYSIRDGSNWEFGIGTYVSPNQLARSYILGTLSSGTWTSLGSALSLSGAAVVRCAAVEELYRNFWRVAPIAVAASQAVANGGSYHVTGNSVTLTLPTAPEQGDRIEFMQGAASVTGTVIDPGSEKINNTAGTMSVDISDFSFTLVYVNASYGWKVDR
jgi:hypothetical protein